MKKYDDEEWAKRAKEDNRYGLFVIIFLIIAFALLATSCQQIFVWTVDGIVGLCAIGLLIIGGIVYGIAMLIEKYKKPKRPWTKQK